ncbi:MAG: DHHW family protein [Emergencia timonensis]|uniref:DHHW family protein n=2 Tax=Emergencia timonensis TaxID=1776384 RepID=UPI0009EE2126|nr:DHHW family protein [Emergencia timonensis]
MNKKAMSSILGLCFIVLLAVTFIINIFTPDKGFSEEENRVLQEKPEFSLSNYMEGRYESKLETYVNDQFLLRNAFIKIKATADVTAGKLESNGVYRCKDNYLMEELTVPSDKLLENTLSSLKQFKRQYKKLDAFFLLAPNAGNILEEKLPNFTRLNDQDQSMDKFFKEIKRYGYTPIDVRDTFAKHTEDTQIYYRTDHHWTTDGAYLAYKQAVKKMKLTDEVTYKPYVVKNDFRGTLASKSGFVNGVNDAIKIYMPYKDKDYNNSVIYYADTKTKTTEFYQLDNLDTKDAYTVFGGSNHPMYTIKTPTKSSKRLLLVKDSYANSFIPFLAQSYREIVVVDPRYFFDNIDDIIKAEEITEVMFLYNANTFFNDNSLEMMLSS